MAKKLTKKLTHKQRVTELTGINLRALKKRIELLELSCRLAFDMIDETRKMIKVKK